MIENSRVSDSVSSLLKIHYDKKFIPVARDFIESMAATTGVTEASSKRLCLLVEESLSFIIDKYIDSRYEAHIELLFKLLDDTALIEIIDIGPPIHEDKMPKFNIQDPESASGLWYKLVKNIADDFSFINNHRDGWLIRIEKKVDMDEEIKRNQMQEDNPDSAPCLSNHNLRLATPEDALELIDLAYLTYRYSYAGEFYDKKFLEESITSGAYEITVVDNGNKIVGAYIVSHPKSGEKWAELGGAMVLPEYRTTRAVMYLFQAMNQYMKENPRNCDFFTSHSVTTHPRSQKLIHRLKPPFMPLFLFPNMVHSPDFIGIRQNQHSRESLLWSFSLSRPFKQEILYASELRHGIIRQLLDNTGFGETVSIKDEFQETIIDSSQILVERVEQQGFAIIHLKSIGTNWFPAITKEIVTLTAAGIESICVSVSSSTPPPADMEEQLRSINLIFSGIYIDSLDSLCLAYCMTTKPIDFENIKLQHPVAMNLLECMRTEYHSLQTP
ncbi:hypothetical protein [Maridesulfovibrio sp.]|uniref:hypothetical protein n=1 Tax=Maridesulfovibrio sp. TaxID=2795000 RepID=UPI002A188295|nr:hypothetical protein [Maridesulfovibrio sp.]